MNETLPTPTYYESTTTIQTTIPITDTASVPIAEPFGGAGALGNTFDMGIGDIVQMGVVYAFIIAGALAAIFIFIGGISFILSGGQEEKIKGAINTIRYAIVGLIITILSFTFISIIGRMFGLNLMQYLSYDKIKNSINTLVEGASSTGNTQQTQFNQSGISNTQTMSTQQTTTTTTNQAISQPISVQRTLYVPPTQNLVPAVIPPQTTNSIVIPPIQQ